MNALVQRWPTFERIARVSIADLPTPVQPLSRVSESVESEVWVKRDDLTAARYGGNKVRKLEYLLGRARERGADTIITTGAVGSHHVFATALYGREHGFETHAVLVPQPYSAHVEDQLRADLAVGARLHTAKSLKHATKEVLRLAVRLRLWGQRPHVIPPGGSNVWGTLGYVNAGVELAQQIDAGLCPDPDAVYVACGTCATAAGLALGLAAAGVRTKVVAVRVTDKLFANRLNLARLVREAQHTLRKIDPRFPPVAAQAIASFEIDGVELGKGYGLSTPSSEAAAHLAASENLTLDSTYTGKALACLLRDAEGARRGQKLLFWHTLSSASMDAFIDDAPDAPEQLVQLMTLTA